MFDKYLQKAKKQIIKEDNKYLFSEVTLTISINEDKLIHNRKFEKKYIKPDIYKIEFFSELKYNSEPISIEGIDIIAA